MLDSITPRNQIQSEPQPQPDHLPEKPKKRFPTRWIIAASMLFLLAVGIFVGSKLVIFAEKILEGEGREFSFRGLFLADDKNLNGEEQGEVRVLLMGVGGEGHEGGTLTDTMILVTLRVPKFKDEQLQVGLVSIPRDLLVNIPGYDFRKINSAYAFGEQYGKNQGPTLAVSTVEETLDLRIPYYAVIDFQGFEQIIEDLGGAEINVENGFTDSLFPDENYGYLPPVTFSEGLQKMSGERALQYVRSRHGNNAQGTDFARSQRQQQLLKAVKEKVSRLNVITNLNLLNRVLDNLAEHLRTNVAPHEIKKLYELARDIKSENIRSLSIDIESGLLCNQIIEETGAYVLLPCKGLGKYEDIRNLVKNQFLIADLQKEKSVIEIQTADQSSAAQDIKSILTIPYLTINISSFRANTVYQQSIVYDNTGGAKPRTLKYIQEKTGMKVASSPYPFPTGKPQPDFVIVAVKNP